MKIVVIVLVITILILNILVKAGGKSTFYDGGYAIANLLSELFVGDMNVGSHTVGVVACGGIGKIGVFDDGAIENSYRIVEL